VWALWETAVCAVFHGLLDPDAQDLAAAIGQHGQREIHGFDAHRRLVANLHAQGIEKRWPNG